MNLLEKLPLVPGEKMCYFMHNHDIKRFSLIYTYRWFHGDGKYRPYPRIARRPKPIKRVGTMLAIAMAMLIAMQFLAACGGGIDSSITTPVRTSAATKPPVKQILTFPNVGIADSAPLDPAVSTDPNTELIIDMVYSGLVRDDGNLNVVPDQATWDISSDQKVYTFHLKSGIAFSDGTPVTAQTYVYSLTRALLPSTQSPDAGFYEGPILGASDVQKGKTSTLVGVRALDSQTLQITLAQPAPYFLQMLTNPVYFPVNEQVINKYGAANWASDVAGNGIGTGPFMVQTWEHSVKMVLLPNPYYYGNKTRLAQVNMLFANDPSVAFNTYRAGQYSFMWNIAPSDQVGAKGFAGFVRVPQLETDAIFFNTMMPPFNTVALRQAFAYAINKQSLARVTLQDTVVPAVTILPPGMPGYQADYTGIPYNKTKALALLQSVYPTPAALAAMPPITFSYPSSLLSDSEAAALRQMWQDALGIPIQMRSLQPTAYNDEVAKHQIQMGFVQWNADYPDPYDALALNLLSTSPKNIAQWSNPTFDEMVSLAESSTTDTRLGLYQQAEQLVIQQAPWIPLDHQEMAAIIPPTLHGVSVNANGLYFGDWSQVYLTSR
jgi:oligopeptide transport system substrate-binding protein